jgi:hypothetical protein
MTGVTPNQGFSFATVGDAPCALPTVFAQLAGQVNDKSLGLDADMARVAANNFVKISKTGPVKGSIVFDTVEVNRGTPTDLSLYNGLLLGPGVWLIGASQIISDTVAGANGAKYIFLSPQIVAIPGDQSTPAVNWTIEGAGGLGGGPLTWPQQTVSVSLLAYVTLPSTKINISPNGGSVTDALAYADSWAWQIGDL